MVASVWNPIDGWVSSKSTKVEVIEKVGPFYLDDFGVVSDAVNDFVPLLLHNIIWLFI